jgi:hypothetical protein
VIIGKNQAKHPKADLQKNINMISKIIPLSQIQKLNLIESHPTIHALIKNFDVDFYRNFEHAAGKSDLGHLTNEQALMHLLERGRIEGRVYNKWMYSFIDPAFYVSRYPELRLKTNEEAVRHWMYIGAFKKMVPNQVTQDLIDADVHLFSMGKVASKSIEASIKGAGYKKLIPHLHWADQLAFSYEHSFFDYAEIINYDTSKPRIFISGVRDPAERVISGYFQSLENPKEQIDISDELFLQKLSADARKVVDWFDHKYFSDIDIYNYPFDKELGYSTIKKNNITIFLYRLDCMKKCWTEISALTGLNLKEQYENRSHDKNYKAKMKAMLSNKELTNSIRRQTAKSKYMEHFFV